MKLPQEIEVQYIIPALRRELVKELKKLNCSQKEISESLELTEAGISQYLSGKRGSEVKFDKYMEKEIQISAKRIKEGKSPFTELQRLCSLCKTNMVLCAVHKKYCDIHNCPKECLK